MIKISVIIPIYNAEKYLKECLDSIINQTLKEIEIICVDDCSTDDSLKILQEYNKKDNRIKIFQNEKNTGGPATGRNKGIDEAQGEYISFIDADDYIENTFLENMYVTAKKYNTDIIFNMNIYKYYEKQNEIEPYIHNIISKNYKQSYLEGISKISIKNIKYNSIEFPDVVVWNKIYKKDTIINKNIRFLPYTNGKDDGTEDNHFFYQLLLNKLTFSYTNKSKYYYRITESSLSNIKTTIAAFYFRTISIIDELKNHEDIIYLNARLFYDFFMNFLFLSEENKEKEYKYLYDIANKIKIPINLIDITIDYWSYSQYSIIKDSKNYDIYIAMKNMLDKFQKLINKIVWFLPLKKWRDNLRKNIL